MAELTKPQIRLLRRMHEAGEVSPRGSEWRTADALVRAGRAEISGVGRRRITPDGLQALREY